MCDNIDNDEIENEVGKTKESAHKLPTYLYNEITTYCKGVTDPKTKESITRTEFWHRAALHYIKCPVARKALIRDTHYSDEILDRESQCSKCGKNIPAWKLVMKNNSQQILCPDCWIETLDEPELRKLLLTKEELKQSVKVWKAYNKQQAEIAMDYRNKEKIKETIDRTQLAQKQGEEIADRQKEFYTKNASGLSQEFVEESKSFIEQQRQDKEEFHKQVDHLKDAVTVIEALTEETIIRSRILKRKNKAIIETEDDSSDDKQ